MIKVKFSCLIETVDYFHGRKHPRVPRESGELAVLFLGREKDVSVWRLELNVGLDIALPRETYRSEHAFHVSQSSVCSLHDSEVFRAATAWSPSLAPTLAVCCEFARRQRTRLFHHTDMRKSPHNIRTDGADSG